MDSEAFRRAYKEVNEQDCVFAKVILTRQAGCREAEWFCIAEREGIRCRDAGARSRCQALAETLKRGARFALKTRDPGELAFAKGLKVQVGGARGLARVLEMGPRADGFVEDIDAVAEAALARFGNFEDLPFGDIVRDIAAWRGRERRRNRRTHQE